MGDSNGLKVALGIILGLISVPVFFYISHPEHYLFAVCMDSIAVFCLSVCFFHYCSGKEDFDAGQIRRAIATTFIFLFLVTLPGHFPSKQFKETLKGPEQGTPQSETSLSGLAMNFDKSLDTMILIILGFYFGARVVENAVGLVFRKEKK